MKLYNMPVWVVHRIRRITDLWDGSESVQEEILCETVLGKVFIPLTNISVQEQSIKFYSKAGARLVADEWATRTTNPISNTTNGTHYTIRRAHNLIPLRDITLPPGSYK